MGHTRTLGLATTLLACLALSLLPASPASAATCPNEAFRIEQGLTGLPDCMALEMVSPPAKALQPAYWPSFSLDGERVLYRSLAALADTPGFQLFKGDPYVATRTPAGWRTAPTSPPVAAAIYGGGASRGGPFVFAPDLSGWMLTGTTRAQEPTGVGQVFRGGLDGAFEAISPLLVGIDNSGSFAFQFSTNSYTGTATAEDLSTTVIRVNRSSISLLPGDPSGNTAPTQELGEDRNSYVAYRDGSGATHLELLARAGEGTVYGGRCGAHSGGEVAAAPPFPKVYQGAISPEGSRIFFSTRPTQPYDETAKEGPPCDPAANGLRIMERVETAPGEAEISSITPDLPQTGDDLYEGASRDGAKVYFTSPRKLSPSDADAPGASCGRTLGASTGCDLYLYDAALPPGERIVQASAGGTGDPSPGSGAGVVGSIAAVSGDASHAYFVASGVLTTDPNPAGATASAGQPNLYLYERDAAHPAGGTAFVGTLAAGDAGQLWGTEGSFFGDAYAVPLYGGAAGGDGHVLFFASKAPLTADDADGGHRDVFRYDAAEETLERISKPNAGSGGADDGPFDATVNPTLRAGFAPTANYGERARWAGEDGQTVAFMTEEALDPTDEDGAPNPYLWKAGQLASVRAEAEEPPSVSPPGDAIGFATKTVLLPADRDLVRDAYVLRVGGGFPPPTEEVPDCEPPSAPCQGGPSVAPGPPANGTATFVWSPKSSSCKKGQVKKKGKCFKKHKRHEKKKAGKDRGGSR